MQLFLLTLTAASLVSGQAAVPPAAVPPAAVPPAAVPPAAAPAAAPADSAGTAAGGPSAAECNNLVGTWNSKANKTMTGPGFYNPVDEKLIEPANPGISYSFTEDGFYEVAYYRAVANPQDPACPKGIMQWQHGQYTEPDNGSLILEPFKVDGRQLYSDPCKYKNAIYTRYNQSELFQRYSAYPDPYHNICRLDLYQFNGAPLMPLYLAMRPPQMLPTSTLNPTATPAAKPTGSSKQRRGLDSAEPLPLNHEFMRKRQEDTSTYITQTNFMLLGVVTTGIGSVLYFFF